MDKVLICLYVPLLEQTYDIYIPINKKVSFIKKLIISTLMELTDNLFIANKDIKLSNKNTSRVYEDNEFIIDTDIRNGTKLVLL